MKVVLVASEVAPFAKTGGLADVAQGLSRELAAQGHDVRIVMPMYGRVRDGGFAFTPVPELQDLTFALGERSWTFSVSTAPLPGSEALVWFVRCPELYGGDEIYGEGGIEETRRFAVLSCAAIEMCQRLGFAPDVFHCNDWHTGLLPLYLSTRYAWDQLFRDTKTLLSIHNIGYQGTVALDALDDLGLADERHLLDPVDTEQGVLNPLRVGVRYADGVSTVSRTYARELLTEEFGMGLERTLREREQDLVGIVNGCDYGEWDPSTDALLPFRYGPDDLSGKADNKAHLLDDFGMTADPDAPLLGIVSRLTGQKGFELVAEALPVFLQRGAVQLVVLGSGEDRYEEFFQRLRDSYTGRVGFYRGYNNELAHRIEAAADMFLMPSRYEPCGLNQMYSLRYGTVPIVRRTGGLADTVEDYRPSEDGGRGTGFVFDAFEGEALFHAIDTAVVVYRDNDAWGRLVQRGMAVDWSWRRQAGEYEALYRRLGATSSD